jgi:orotidine-5'-phosphate decarboxylase
MTDGAAARSEARARARERVIVALDVPDRASLSDFLDRLEGQPAFYKVGLELFVAEGARAVEMVRQRGGRVFLDLKLHDISETVARAVTTAVGLGVELLTVHAAGGSEMLRRAVDAAAGRVKLIAVTVLTSLTAADLVADGIAGTVGEAVLRRARVAASAGVAGIVCSPHEVAEARVAVPNLLLVVPGVRPSGAALGDQKRVATPAATLRAGADHLVVGRPIRDAAAPAAAFNAIVDEIEAAG